MNTDAGFEGEDLDALAAEYVLGLTPPEEQAEVRLRLSADPAFAAMVANWQERFTRLTDDIKPRRPPRKLKAAISRRMFGHGTRQQKGPSLWMWQAISFAALGLAAYMSYTDLEVEPPVAPPVFLAAIQNADAGVDLIVVYDPLRRSVGVRQLRTSAPDGRVLELWAIAPGSAPVSLGVLSDAENTQFPLPEVLADQAAAFIFAVSDEPEGGSPSGAPSGGMLASGPASRL